jgi:lipoprotein-releasing system permease protein
LWQKFEWFVAGRYLRARRREAVISVITVISVLGVSAGVMALIISLAINNGFRNTLQRDLLGATAHVNVLEKEPGEGIRNWRALDQRLRKIPHVIATAPVLYGQVFLSGPQLSHAAVIKGVQIADELRTSDTLKHLRQGSTDRLNDATGLPTIVLGKKLADDTGLVVNSVVNVTSPQGKLTPMGPVPYTKRYRVIGIFESGFYDIDDNWAYASMENVQRLLSVQDVVNSIELKLDDLYLAPQVSKQAEDLAGARYAATNWQEQNRQLLSALKMERIVTSITIGLIELVAALNILITLVMMAMERYRDIAVLMAMGARRGQIRGIFMRQGLLIGLAGTTFGLAAGYTLCYFANRYHWIRLDETVYALSFVPFEPRAIDGLWVAAAALLISLLATLYPASQATRITPVEVLRYE